MTAITAAWNDLRSSAAPLRSVWTLIAVIVFGIAILDPAGLAARLRFAAGALAHTAPYVLFAVLAIGFLKATQSEALVAKAFRGRESRMILLAALAGGLAPFCSCEVIPFVAALLAAGTPVSAVMAFWLSSPLMDPPAFAITAGALGAEYAIGKTVAAVGIGLMGGFAMKLAMARGAFANPLKPRSGCGSCCGAKTTAPEVRWDFWSEPERRADFREASLENALFLLKWLTLAYLLESVMIAYVPAETIAGVVGGPGVGPVILGALVGIPAYLNGYAAPPLVAGLMEQGMSAGAAMSFMLAGGMTCIPAAAAVWALVKPRVFAAYLGLAFSGAIIAALVFASVLPLLG